MTEYLSKNVSSHQLEINWLFRFECHVCHKRFGRYQLMDSHIKSKHLGVEQVWCPQCGFWGIDAIMRSRNLETVDQACPFDKDREIPDNHPLKEHIA